MATRPGPAPDSAAQRDARTACVKMATRCVERWAKANTDVVRALAAVSNTVLQRPSLTEAHLPGLTTLQVEQRRQENTDDVAAAYEALQQARQPLLDALADLTAALESLCGMLDDVVRRGVEQVAAASAAAAGVVADTAAAPPQPQCPPWLEYVTRACGRARAFAAELRGMYVSQAAMTQAAVVSVLPRSCEAAWRRHCAARAAALASTSTEAAAGGDGSAPSAEQLALLTAAAAAALPPSSPSFGLAAAGEGGREHLTALAAAVAVQPYVDVPRRDELLAGLEHIAAAAYGGGDK